MLNNLREIRRLNRVKNVPSGSNWTNYVNISLLPICVWRIQQICKHRQRFPVIVEFYFVTNCVTFNHSLNILVIVVAKYPWIRLKREGFLRMPIFVIQLDIGSNRSKTTFLVLINEPNITWAIDQTQVFYHSRLPPLINIFHFH